jgi:hypothetical protein
VYQFDARYTRDFAAIRDRYHAQLLVEATNIFNHSNFTGDSTTATVQGCIISGANLCSNATTPAAGSTFIAGQVTAPPSFAHTGGLEARILEFGLKITF